MNRGTLNQLFFTTVDRHAGLPAAFRSKVGGTWVGITHREALEVMIESYDRMGLKELRDDTKKVLAKNYPHDKLTQQGANRTNSSWWKFWD